MDAIYEKQQKLKKYLRELGCVAVAFSAGVDSTFLLKTAKEVLGDKAVAFTAQPVSFPEREYREAALFCSQEQIRQVVIPVRELEIPGFRQNPTDRCYLCKRELFSRMCREAEERQIPFLVEGSNMDDMGDYRPGMRAIRELGIKSPLQEAGLSKAEIRELSKEMGLPTWDKPPFACLATRFVYGEEITEEKLKMVERAEQYLFDLGFRQVRVRIHGNMARIETEQAELVKILEQELAERINQELKKIGFVYVALDLGGYRQGSMNLNIR